MQINRRRLHLGVTAATSLMIGVLLLSGCGGGGSASTPPNFEGSYTGNAVSTDGNPGAAESFTIKIIADGQVSGTDIHPSGGGLTSPLIGTIATDGTISWKGVMTYTGKLQFSGTQTLTGTFNELNSNGTLYDTATVTLQRNTGG